MKTDFRSYRDHNILQVHNTYPIRNYGANGRQWSRAPVQVLKKSVYFMFSGFIWYWRCVNEHWRTFLAPKTFPKINFNDFFVNLRMSDDMTKAKKVSERTIFNEKFQNNSIILDDLNIASCGHNELRKRLTLNWSVFFPSKLPKNRWTNLLLFKFQLFFEILKFKFFLKSVKIFCDCNNARNENIITSLENCLKVQKFDNLFCAHGIMFIQWHEYVYFAMQKHQNQYSTRMP